MINIPIKVGDVILTGKFKNHKVTVQEIGTDDYGLPTVNGKGIMKIRIQKLIPKKTQESNMRNISEAPATNNPKVQKIVDEINKLIASAVDGDGDPIEVVDKTSSWEEPMIYQPIVYKNGSLTITYTEPMSRNKKNVETIKKANMEFDGIPTLRGILNMYKKATKQSGKPTTESRVFESTNIDKEIIERLEFFINLYAGSRMPMQAELGRNILKSYKSGTPIEDLIASVESDMKRNGNRSGYEDYLNALQKLKMPRTKKLENKVTHKDVTIKENQGRFFVHSKIDNTPVINIYGYNTQQHATASAVFKGYNVVSESKRTSKMKLSEVISKGVFINIKKEDGKFWFYIDTVDGPECISNVGFPTKEAAEHAALTKGFNVKKGGDAEDEMPDTVEVPKPSKRETTKGTEKPKEIDLGKEKEIKLEEQIKRMIRSEIRRVTESFQKKKSLTEGTEITKKIEDSLAQLKDLQDKIASAKAEIDAIMKRTGLKDLEKKSDDILKDGLWDFFEELKKDEQRIVKFQDIVMTVKRFQASPATYEYEKVLDFAMTQVNQDVKAKILAELKASEKIGKTKAQVSFTTEGVGDIWNSVKQLFSRLIPSLKLKGKKIDAGISSAENALKKIR